MPAVQRDNPLQEFLHHLGSAQKGVLMLNLDVLVAPQSNGGPLRTLGPALSLLGKLTRTTNTRVVIISERTEYDCSSLVPDPWPDELSRNGGGGSRAGSVEFHAEIRNKAEIVRKIAKESDGIPHAYLGSSSSDEAAFHTLSGVGLGILVRSELRLTAARVLLRPPEELVRFLNQWFEACRGLGVSGERFGGVP